MLNTASDFSNQQLQEFYFLLTNIGLDYDIYKKMSENQRQELIKSIKNDYLTKFRKEKITKIFND